MNVYEMEGFLRGKCIPRDILVNESTAEYLVRKLNEATTVKAERDALAVENAELKGRKPLGYIKARDLETLREGNVAALMPNNAFGESPVYQPIETPATDAALAAIRLEAKIEGANELAERIAEMHSKTAPGSNIEKKLMFAAEAAIAYANGLREAK
ncbi:Uncharacterised protein [Serratia entomophila]|uniref:hypothetical protein n=1 Tax=Serratia entomophila TaxID=42906 RepID=UPI002179E88D|nr:hypothetical protein [Serratia entomophila]CAI1787679.1 Uncharacterised protein [Serratia entomophila]